MIVTLEKTTSLWLDKANMDHQAFKTCRRINEPGHAHFITFSCFKRRPFLEKDRSRKWMIDAIKLSQEKHRFDLWAYVIMPEHVHLLIYPTQMTYSISSILGTMKTSVTRRALMFLKKEAPGSLRVMEDRKANGNVEYRFWQRGGGYDANLINAEQLPNTIHYIHENPVQRGLCTTPQEWKWSSALEYASPGSGLLPIQRNSLPMNYE